MTTSLAPVSSHLWPIALAIVFAWRLVASVWAFLWIVLLVAFWRIVGHFQPPPLIRCVQCGTELRSRQPRCQACAGS